MLRSHTCIHRNTHTYLHTHTHTLTCTSVHTHTMPLILKCRVNSPSVAENKMHSKTNGKSCTYTPACMCINTTFSVPCHFSSLHVRPTPPFSSPWLHRHLAPLLFCGFIHGTVLGSCREAHLVALFRTQTAVIHNNLLSRALNITAYGVKFSCNIVACPFQTVTIRCQW